MKNSRHIFEIANVEIFERKIAITIALFSKKLFNQEKSIEMNNYIQYSNVWKFERIEFNSHNKNFYEQLMKKTFEICHE